MFRFFLIHMLIDMFIKMNHMSVNIDRHFYLHVLIHVDSHVR